MTTFVRWNPLQDMASMQGTLDRLFDDTRRNLRSSNDAGALALDVHETDPAYIVSAALPGVSADAVNISLHDGVLTISGEVPQVTHENSRALLLERSYGKFQRVIRLPQPIDASKVEANIENGVLTLTLPKTLEAQPRTIPVKTGNSFSQN
ncbi:MAG TPA: Hsp20/alpha crystallin family protein [Phototrophicaceae bacterium]|nr:Hsp20/alpha crystallin family protein [Phototrophicaceae bacterium]